MKTPAPLDEVDRAYRGLAPHRALHAPDICVALDNTGACDAAAGVTPAEAKAERMALARVQAQADAE
ncbi:hypothetical protein OIU91_04925 [Streptomyces sp. NBC_01456]|uniref:hypothetical protein n=1 Tax=unclassified Streptomyces TaxID=2593676 RepID=UPI002E368851|nr:MULTISPECIES: hypothetical protein [unclassified Streptomyces]